MPNKRNAVGSPSRAMGKKRRTANRTGGQIMQNEEITQKKDGAGRRRIAKKTQGVGHVVAEGPVETTDFSSVNAVTNQRSQENSDISLSERQPQITEGSLNYADVVFEPGPPTREVIIHGLQDKTHYSEIRFSENTAIVSVSSDESDDDFIYIDGLENYLEKREKKYGEQT